MSPKSNEKVKSPRRPRGSLSKDKICDAARSLIEEEGIDGLSMPSLARYLDAGVMSVYWYFHSKDDLLLELADRAFLDLYSRLPEVSGTSWVDESIALSRALHRELREVPLYLQLCRVRRSSLALRPDVIPAVAQRLESELEIFEQSNVSIAKAVRFLTVLSAYARGFALMQVGADEERLGDTPEQALEASVAQLNPSKFPTLCAVEDAGKVVGTSDASFNVALRLLVAGMQAEVEHLSEFQGSASPAES